MDRNGLINLVKIKLDEFTPTGVDLPFNNYIDPILEECAVEVLEQAPLGLITPANLILTSKKFENYTLYIPVPSDYIRLYEMKLPGWTKSVRRAITEEDPDFAIQENEHTKAGLARPVVVIKDAVPQSTAGKYLACAKASSDADPTIYKYVKSEKPENLDERLSEALTWLCASKILQVEGYGDKSVAANQEFQKALIRKL